MTTLVLRPTIKTVGYSLLSNIDNTLELAGVFGNGLISSCQEFSPELDKIRQAFEGSIDSIVIRVLYGGSEFAAPELVTSKVLDRMEMLIDKAPMHIPGSLELIKSCQQVLSGIPVVLVFETSFFIDLPKREYVYGVHKDIGGDSGIRRFGYHGIYHKAACEYVRREMADKVEDEAISCFMPNIISVCLDMQSEVAAVRGQRPLMVNRGATPLEGICGNTSCGEIDPSIVLTLSEMKGWGPQQINHLLTRESGLLGLTGDNIALDELFTVDKPQYELAKEIIKYRLLNSCGAAMAALGGVDALVFSGKCVAVADILGEYLSDALTFSELPSNKVPYYSLDASLDELLVSACA